MSAFFLGQNGYGHLSIRVCKSVFLIRGCAIVGGVSKGRYWISLTVIPFFPLA